MNAFVTASVYLGLVLVGVASIELGRFVGREQRKRKSAEPSGTLGSNVGGLLALLAFMLAVTFSLTSDRYAKRKTLVLEEANALSTAYLRTDFLVVEEGERVRQLLWELVEVRTQKEVMVLPDRETQTRTQRRSQELRDELWQAFAAGGGRGAVDSELQALFVDSLNDLLDINTERETVILVHQVPPLAWGVLGGIAILSMVALGYQAGVQHRARAASSFALVMAFAAALSLSIDMDRPGFGFSNISQQPMLDVRAQIEADLQVRARARTGAGTLVRHRAAMR